MTIEAPRRVTDLRRAVTVLARERGITERRLVSLVANVALAQMLPESAVKGPRPFVCSLSTTRSPRSCTHALHHGATVPTTLWIFS